MADFSLFFKDGLNRFGFFLDLYLLSFVVKVFVLFSDNDFGSLGAGAQENGVVGFVGEGDLVAVLIEIGEVEVVGVKLEDLGDEALEFLEGLGVGGLQDMDFLIKGNFEKHLRKIIITL